MLSRRNARRLPQYCRRSLPLFSWRGLRHSPHGRERRRSGRSSAERAGERQRGRAITGWGRRPERGCKVTRWAAPVRRAGWRDCFRGRFRFRGGDSQRPISSGRATARLSAEPFFFGPESPGLCRLRPAPRLAVRLHGRKSRSAKGICSTRAAALSFPGALYPRAAHAAVRAENRRETAKTLWCSRAL